MIEDRPPQRSPREADASSRTRLLRRYLPLLFAATAAAGAVRFVERMVLEAALLDRDGWAGLLTGLVIYVGLTLGLDGLFRAFSSDRSGERPSELRRHTAERLAALRDLPRDWDGHGSEPPGDDAGYDAGWLLQTVARRAPNVPPPNVNATRGGRIQIDWERGGRYFEVTVPGGGEAWLFYEDPAAGVSREWERPLPECLDDVLEHSRRVTA